LHKILSDEKIITALVGAGLITLFTSVFLFLWQDYQLNFSLKIDSEKIAQFGDFIGGVSGSIWALAGVLLFYKALTEQRTDFKNNKESLDLQAKALLEQIEEVKLNRIELESTRKIYVEQSKTLKTQQFESNFYSFLNVHLMIKNNLSSDDIFQKFNDLIIQDTEGETVTDRHNSAIAAYSKSYSYMREKLSPYFRSLYRLITIIEKNTALTKNEKFFYAKIVRAQISDFELLILFYNSCTVQGNKMQNHILAYNMLKHLHVEDTPYLLSKTDSIGSAARIEIANTLYSYLDNFLLTHFEKFYDIKFEKDRVEEYQSDIKAFLGLYTEPDGHLVFKLKYEKDKPSLIGKFGDHLVQETLLAFFNYRLKYSKYLQDGDLNITPSITEYEHSKVYCIEIQTNQ
jgi:hypothetical protein